MNQQNKIKILLFGSTGFIGKKVSSLIETDFPQIEIINSQSRLENTQDVAKELDLIQPDRVINAAGITGIPNVDWCESHKQETLRVNLVGSLALIDSCWKRNIHIIQFGTGCIYQYDENHKENSGNKFTEKDPPNFFGSYYSKTKGIFQDLLDIFDNVLLLRIRMPITSHLEDSKNLISKLIKYSKVVNIPNSMSVLEDLLPVMVDMCIKKVVGVFNFTNPGSISHNEILTLYQKFIDPNFKWENFSIEEQNKILKAERSNNELDSSKLLEIYPDIPHIKDSMIKVFERIKKSIKNQ
ncbi:trifunctional udp-glucose 46-dehydratase/udp-4-keto-6-deoxy-d-glucose 35-epimerase/udp-4-keto-l-rhamnose-reductase rhm3-like [Anaeramoeba ignava]|uniref:Trifunctional udp-glucose 46-dehydratase/udp-4-keto-6-deoxy-d-glucose 35-epimerase/udp-4-keto-l-rhamnose-reductase rhm3-like n=1 Tax=Anaeramoeba ignava TaxID=1746090 RepID=A0A9Q0LAL3_ANAIG|nr:trifunctional udp-glucose 46-dehydratase/udp-4-keto-6-deoxy-d-glucose 35-epimerase/udp-4-keto-l-rhamnose-reductase rhm3-like [Anaeramoeba ignava]